MKKILLLLLLFLSTSLIEVEAQGIIGKWRLPQQKKNGLECWVEMEFNPNNIVTAVLEFITKDESYSELGVIIDFAAEVHGKYEHSGKALCVDYDLNSPKIKKFNIEYASDCKIPVNRRKEFYNYMKTETEKQIPNTLKVMLSGGMYKQILMLNYEKMIWGRLGKENEEYYRIIPETELAAARQKREEEHISRRQARHKYEEECAAIMTDEETTAIPMKKIINIQDVEKIELKEIDDQKSFGKKNKDSETDDDNRIYAIVETEPQFRGGAEALSLYLQNNIMYPTICQEQGIQGRVVVQFVVNKDGSIVDPEVIKPINPDLDKEALRVVSTMPKWIPGEQNGKKVRVRYTLPVHFSKN